MKQRYTALPVLLYHHVGPAMPGTHRSLTVEPARFRRHLAWLWRHGYRSLSIAEVEKWALEDGPLPRRGVLITFDDGYRDLAVSAFPALESAGYSATVFVVTGLLGERNSRDAATGHAGHGLLTVEEVRVWNSRGVEFGAHTRTHANLDHLSLPEAEQEIVGSKEDLEELVQRPVRSFAYPWGVAGRFGRRIAADNFSVAFCDADGLNLRGADRSWLRRTMMQTTDGGLDLVSRVRLGRSLKHDARAAFSRARSA